MSIKLNHFICPRCGHDFYAEGAYATCDGCQTVFYASQSKTCSLPHTSLIRYPAGSVTGGGYWLNGEWVRTS